MIVICKPNFEFRQWQGSCKVAVFCRGFLLGHLFGDIEEISERVYRDPMRAIQESKNAEAELGE